MALTFVVWLGVTMASPGGSVNAVLYVHPLLRSVDFALGVVVYRLYASPLTAKVRSFVVGRATLVEAGAILLLVGSYFAYGLLPANLRCCGLFYLVIPVVVYVFSVTDPGKGLVTRLLHGRAVLFLGGLSFEVYILHLFVMRLFGGAVRALGVPADSHSPVYVAFCFAVVLAISYLVRRCFTGRLYGLLRGAVGKT